VRARRYSSHVEGVEFRDVLAALRNDLLRSD
jgi:hypothetical protein